MFCSGFPEARLTDKEVPERQRDLYKKWHDARAFKTTQGDMIDYDVIKEDSGGVGAR